MCISPRSTLREFTKCALRRHGRAIDGWGGRRRGYHGQMLSLPPPDPNEAYEPTDLELSSPAAIFLTGPPSADEDRLADAILERRPGALVVVSRLTSGP